MTAKKRLEPAASLTGMSLAFGSALCYAANTPLAKLGATHGLPAQHMGLYRAVALLAGVVLVLHLRGTLRLPSRRTFPGVILLGCGGTGVALGYLGAVNFIPVGLAAIIFYTYPLLVMLAAPLIDGTPLSALRIVLALVAFAGLVIAIAPAYTSLQWQGLVLAALAAVSSAIMFFAGAWLAREGMGALSITAGAQSVAVVLILSYLLAFSDPLQVPDSSVAWWVLGLVTALFAGAYLLQMQAVAVAVPAAIGIVYYIEPVLSAGIAALLLDERLSVLQYAGGMIVLLALFAAGMTEWRARRSVAAE